MTAMDVDEVTAVAAMDPGKRLVLDRLHANYVASKEPRTLEELGLMMQPQITRQAVHRWERVPVHHCLRVSQILDIPLHKLRPDVFPPEMQVPKQRKGKIRS